MNLSKEDYTLIKESGLLNMRWYKQEYRDVELLGMDPIEHYVKYGAYMERNPGKNFSTSFYLKEYLSNQKDRGVNPLLHYLKIGKEKGYATSEKNFNVLLEAKALIDSGDFRSAFDFVLDKGNEAEKSGLNILKASHYRSDRGKWVGYVNQHLQYYRLSPIKLKNDANSVYKGIFCDLTRKVSKGVLVSVIMPAYNAEETLAFAAESILKQTWKNIELIIVDDCSTDATYQIAQGIALKDGRVKVLRNYVNMGPYVSKNRAVSICDGVYITGHDADDWAHPERIENHVKYMLDNPQVKASATKMLRVTENGSFDRVSVKNINTCDGVTQVAFISTMFETEFFKKEIGAWDCVKFGADSEVINRCRSVLGSNFKILDQLGMICLDSDTGLTSHPEFGTRGRTSPVRKNYKKSFLAWHNSLGLYKKPGQYKLNYPHHPRRFKAPPESLVDIRDIRNNENLRIEDRSFDLDVAIVTDLRFPGGNASTTIDEIKTLSRHGVSARIFNCPSELSYRKPISQRYLTVKNLVETDFYNIEAVQAKVLIVRSPSVISSPHYLQLVSKIKAKSVIYVINNSIYKGSGEHAYDIELLAKGLKALEGSSKRLFPLSGLIKDELEALKPGLPLKVEDNNWHPLFDSSSFTPGFDRKIDIGRVVIGRHGRDHVDKWPSNKKDILKVYPKNKPFEVRILGGADMAKDKLGQIPKNWKVYPFGSLEPQEFLSELDFFVYFPSEKLTEAFGRVVMEAIFSGVPCILPKRFESTFGDLAYYCELDEVEEVVKSLANNYQKVMLVCKDRYYKALETYDSGVLLKRISNYTDLDV